MKILLRIRMIVDLLQMTLVMRNQMLAIAVVKKRYLNLLFLYACRKLEAWRNHGNVQLFFSPEIIQEGSKQFKACAEKEA